jgi:hypothetical protein
MLNKVLALDGKSRGKLFNSSGKHQLLRLSTNFLLFSFTTGWGLKALSVFVTVKIKILLLLLFMGGGIFYGLKIWQGTALGCPEPLIQEIVKNHHHETVLPYHGHTSHDDISSYPGYSSYGSGFDLSGVYSNSPGPASYSGPSYLPPSGGSSVTAPSDSYGSPPPSAVDASGAYRRKSSTGRQMSDESSSSRQISDESTAIFGDLIFRFLGVITDQCRRRFVCELQFRNPFLGYAVKYMG